MLTYQIHPRIFRLEPGRPLVFPARCELCFHFQPGQPFGMRADGGRTAVKAVAATALFDANTGEHTVTSKEPLAPLDVTITEPSRVVKLDGCTLTIGEEFENLGKMEEMIQSIYYALPPLLSVPFADPPYIERVDGRVAENRFRWELRDWKLEFRTTTQETQEEAFARCWNQMGTLSQEGRRRLLAGLHYFHLACRLARAGAAVGEFMAEVLLNLAKALEVLFPPEGDGRSRDAVRSGLLGLGFAEEAVERDYMPAMALRNEIDVAHVQLGLFRREHLKTIHTYTERAEGAFRVMFETILKRMQSGQFEISSHVLGPPTKRAIQLVERLANSLELEPA